jgi:hypothetical protein
MMKSRISEKNGKGGCNERTHEPRFWGDPLRVHILRCGRITILALEVPEEVWVKDKELYD